ncbi:EAL domain-containing protein [Litoribrevibacter albus]|uniref:Bifunctional diguanylate cyclase/phosphodiesterase n=1 Tax=Litoribrevibacter albus TaxID=1473156 RepID=A0AA37S7B7_9GAMM|nr:EAL domain-containing protein [Litoribrevibacter albus]GLQ29829.1 bifunctional diguanylate cyclase/phosphodiesterase [Litoribrevibacter albus]
MRVAFQKKISTKLAKQTVIIAFFVGLILSSIQVYLDYQEHEESLSHAVDQMIAVSSGSAARAVRTLDESLAKEVVNGFMHYEFIHSAEIIDDLGVQLARSEPGTASEIKPSRLTEWLVDADENYVQPLKVSQEPEAGFGKLVLVIDWDVALSPFYHRLVYVVTSGLVRNMLLALILFYVFYAALAEPMHRVAQVLRKVNPINPSGARLSQDLVERGDELGVIADMTNEFFASVEKNIKQRDSAELRLSDSLLQTREIIDNVPHPICARDTEGRFLFVNSSLAEFYGLDEAKMEELNQYELHRGINEDQSVELEAADRSVLRTGESCFIADFCLTDHDSNLHYFQTSLVPFTYFGQASVLSIMVDITARKQAEEKVIELAFYDALTGLPNRNLLTDRLDLEMRRAERHHSTGALLFIDLDNFKGVNDSFGHAVGDQVLQHVAEQLKGALRAVDTVARLGGDEFLVILPELSENLEEAKLSAQSVAKMLTEKIATPFFVKNRDWVTSASIGIAMYPNDCNNVNEVMRFADTAMYEAKKQGRNKHVFFEIDMASRAESAYSLENELRVAVAQNQFFLVFQPQVGVQDGVIQGAEVLIRWRHPDRGIVPPFEFIPVLESSGLIYEVGKWIIREACYYIRKWQDLGLWHDEAWLSVNVSPNQFYNPVFVDDVMEALKEAGLSPTALELEITEGIVIRDTENTIKKLELLRSNGIRIAMDDFGTGYSSLSYLKRIPLDVLKIDQSFVRDITVDPTDKAIVEAILSMSKNIGLEVVAEGIETEEHYKFFKGTSCQRYQGYLYSPPVECKRFEDMLRERVVA